jgi:broad specificity phosphatase PhoE
MKTKPIMPSQNAVTVILARHGETVANRQGIVLGWQDSPLTPEGKAMVQNLARLLPASPSGMIVSSPLGRAVTSAGIFASHTGWPVRIVDELAEISAGQWEGHPRREIMPDRTYLRSSWDEAPPDGESYRDTEIRVATAIEKINAISHHDPILIVGHAAVNRVILKIWQALQPEEAMKLQFSHTVLYNISDNELNIAMGA